MFLFVLVAFQIFFISSSGEDFRADRDIVWHWTNFVEGRMMLRPNLFLGSDMLLKVVQTGSSSHILMNFDATPSSFSQIQVFEISETVKFHEIFESR